MVSGGTTNCEPEWEFVLVCPLSSSSTRKTRFDVQLAAGQGNVTKKTWVRIPAVQPLMKRHLEDYSGTLDGRLLSQIHARLAQYMGMLDNII